MNQNLSYLIMWHFCDESILFPMLERRKKTTNNQNNHHPIVEFFRSDGSSKYMEYIGIYRNGKLLHHLSASVLLQTFMCH